ncbi:MAG: glycogen debranching enzyme N-terminal domain-containing protein, partial [Kiritimatiellia bacterium]
MIQNPPAGAYLLHHAADTFRVTLTAPNLPPGRAVFRTNLARAAVNRSEIIRQTEDDTPPLARGWHDLAMTPDAPGHWTLQIPLLEEGIFSGKCCFLPDSGEPPIWPQGDNLTIKVAPAHTARGNSIYAAFIRQFGPDAHLPEAPHGGPEPQSTLDRLDQNGYTAIPPSGTFRSFAKALPHIVQTLGFRNILLLPIHPTPTTYARMGRYGSPFASTDFLSVDPALADFDTHATPIEQFTQLVAQVHALGARLLMDLPANHCGWASTLLTHHPEWFKRNPDGSYHSPGAWGVVWEDLVELDYSHPRLCRFMADVFLHWCRKGVDGFRCDAGYMIPEKTWTYIVAKVREKFPETVFLLEGLGGPIQTTDRLLNRSGLDWAYSELFQTYDRAAFERELPQTFHRSTRFGPLVHFAETHDNNRLAAHPGGQTWALLRVRLSALLSQEGAWGITAGVEYFAQQKIDVHGCGGLNWGAKNNMIEPISKLNRLLEMHPSFGPGVNLRMVQQGPGNTLAVLRSGAGRDLLVLANLDPFQPQPVSWDASIPMPPKAWDHIAESWVPLQGNTLELAPGALLCLDPAGAELAREIPDSRRTDLMLQRAGTARRVPWNYPKDLHRVVPVPADAIVAFSAATPFRVCWRTGADDWCDGGRSVRLPSGDYRLLSRPLGETFRFETVQGSSVELREGTLAICQEKVSADALQTIYSGGEIRRNPFLRTVLGNGAGAMAQVRLAWGTLRSQYDALFAANLNRSIPVDRTVFWTRCRGWVQYQGYSSELEAGCLSQVSVDPAGRYAQWDFRVPCGMGLSVGIVLRLALRPLENEARLTVLRRSEAGQEEPTDGVRVVLRPDVEWRSFHTKTKAFEVEGDWSGRVSDGARGFRFGEASLEAVGGLWHREDQWTYGVEHGDDAERGLGGKSDLFSPGWFSFDLKGGESGMVVARAGEVASGGWEEPRDWVREGATLGAFLRAALGLYIVRRDGHKSVIAGYPWFLDW